MKTNKFSNQGFSHHIVLVAIVTGAVMVSVFLSVLHASHKDKSSVNTAASSSHKKGKLSSETSEKSTASTLPTGSSANNNTSAKPAATAPAKSTAPATASSSSLTAASSGSSTPAQTPLSALTAIISSLQAGGQANVTAAKVGVPGPITTAQARPIVFSVNSQTYFAYTQGQAANFNTSAAEVANTMAITQASGGPSLTQAHLSKTNNLVDQDSLAVGYSTGGN